MTILPPPDGIYTTDSLTVPFPLNLAPLLRREHRSRHWAMVLEHIYGHENIFRYTPRQLAAAWRLRDLLGLNSRHPLAGRYVRLLVPVASCKHCGADFLQEAAKRLECSDRCRRLEAETDRYRAMRRARYAAKRAAAKCEDQKGNQQ
jgi:hypothetical protein